MRLPSFISRSVRRKTIAVAIATAFAALLVNALALLAYDFRTYRQSQNEEVRTQAEIVGRASAAALAFNDRKAAMIDLRALALRPDVQHAALYGADGNLFASYIRDSRGGTSQPPNAPEPSGLRYAGDSLVVFHEIIEGGNKLGTVHLSVRSGLYERVAGYVGILLAVMAAALATALLLSTLLQRTVTDPIVSISRTAGDVVRRRDFTLRAQRQTDDEIGGLADAFNRMLAEVEARQEELRLADRRKDEFLATLAHELRNPLAPIRNALYIMKLSPGNAAAAADAREMIERQLAQMIRLVDDLIDISRITTGKLALRRERIELGAVIRNALEAVAPLAKFRGHTLRTRLPEDPVVLNADPTRLAQVFLNLLNNAIKFTDPGGHLELDVRIEEAQLVARVRDDGIGIAADQLESIFDMFAQADRSLERSAGGLGVGLALTRRLVELHGGTVVGRSAGLGRGSEFEVRIPVTGNETPHGGAGRRAQASEVARPHRILLVDDNRDFALSLAGLLRGMGNEVRVEHDGAAGLAAGQEFRPDIALLDIGMPRMNGFDVARRMRDTPETTGSILVAITGFSQQTDRDRAREAGFDHYFVKPVEVETLEEILRK